MLSYKGLGISEFTQIFQGSQFVLRSGSDFLSLLSFFFSFFLLLFFSASGFEVIFQGGLGFSEFAQSFYSMKR